MVTHVVKHFMGTTDWVPQEAAALRWRLACKIFVRKFSGHTPIEGKKRKHD